MGKKKGLAAIFSRPKLTASAASDGGSPSPPWPWPSCATTPQTASFRGQLGGGRRGDDRPPCSRTAAGQRSVLDAAVPGTGRLLLLPSRSSTAAPGNMYKMVNSVYMDDPADGSCFSFDDDEEEDADAGDVMVDDVVSFSTATASEEWSEAVIRSLGRRNSTDRFFFDSGPPPASNSILAASSRSPSPKAPAAAVASSMPDTEEGSSSSDIHSVEEFELEQEEQQQHHEEPRASPLVEESVAVALDSEDPYRDFRASMEEMVAAHGLRDWPALQEMLLWYLRINAKHTHALIVGAFVDLLIGLATKNTTATPTTTTVTNTTTTTNTAATTSSGSSSSSSTSSVAGDGASAITCSTAAKSATATIDDEQCQCGGGSGSGSGTDASWSPASPSSDLEDEEGRPVGKAQAGARDELAFHVKLCT